MEEYRSIPEKLRNVAEERRSIPENLRNLAGELRNVAENLGNADETQIHAGELRKNSGEQSARGSTFQRNAEGSHRKVGGKDGTFPALPATVRGMRRISRPILRKATKSDGGGGRGKARGIRNVGAAAETTRRPRGLRRVSWTGCVVSTGALEAWPEVGVTGGVENLQPGTNFGNVALALIRSLAYATARIALT